MTSFRPSPAGYPMAPSAEEWEALSPAERAAVVAALPAEVTYDEMAMPEGDRHAKAKARALDALRGYFTRQRRRIYLAQEIPTYYPASRASRRICSPCSTSKITIATSGSSARRARGSTGCS